MSFEQRVFNPRRSQGGSKGPLCKQKFMPLTLSCDKRVKTLHNLSSLQNGYLHFMQKIINCFSSFLWIYIHQRKVFNCSLPHSLLFAREGGREKHVFLLSLHIALGLQSTICTQSAVCILFWPITLTRFEELYQALRMHVFFAGDLFLFFVFWL